MGFRFTTRLRRWTAAAIAVATVGGLSMSSDVAAASWSNRAYGYSLTPGATPSFVAIDGSTRSNAQKIRYEVRWNAPSGRSAPVAISWYLTCWDGDFTNVYEASNEWNPTMRSGGVAGRTWNMGRDNCYIQVVAEKSDNTVPGNLRVYVKEYR
ncbi:hypothetical protein [Ilumatobacter nonamiensis]|uniref:hypothetical protein n=1 Tax=Ilumatobacter nonamiensis TaxID=467093 RepID=UPI00058D0C9C|nr:hypothetical protein [Ilumatobacter nonamiensis]